MEKSVEKNGQNLKYGYTTGSCARIAVRAALKKLLLGMEEKTERLVLSDDLIFDVEILDRTVCGNTASCGVKKYSGDDPDITNGTMIYAQVSVTEGPETVVSIEGGVGIGRVTKKGLDQPVGNAAINSGPRKSITQEALQVAEAAGFTGRIDIMISAPDGERLAEKTFNPKLGIVGGISILGTTGILEPMSDKALIETIKTNLNVVKEAEHGHVVIVPGNIGETFAREELAVKQEQIVQCSNFVGEALLYAYNMGFEKISLVGHAGKLIKLAGKMMNTHSMYGDCRKEIMAAYAAVSGCKPKGICAIMNSVSTDDMVDILMQEKENVLPDTFRRIVEEIDENICYYIRKNGQEFDKAEHGSLVEFEVILFDGAKKILGRRNFSN